MVYIFFCEGTWLRLANYSDALHFTASYGGVGGGEAAVEGDLRYPRILEHGVEGRVGYKRLRLLHGPEWRDRLGEVGKGELGRLGWCVAWGGVVSVVWCGMVWCAMVLCAVVAL